MGRWLSTVTHLWRRRERASDHYWFRRRRVRYKKIKDEELIAMAVGGGGIGINPHSPPSNDEDYVLRCRAEGEAAKIRLVTCKSPHVPESLTTR
jgi:hypothetical protein